MQAMSSFDFAGQLLVPICEVKSIVFPCDVTEASSFPEWAEKGWIYFRLRVDNLHARIFWSPDRRTWRVQLRGGEVLEFGRPIALGYLSKPTEGVDVDQYFGHPSGSPFGQVYALRHDFRWNLTRRFDPSPDGGEPNNVVVYRWGYEYFLSYLTDVYYSPPARQRGHVQHGDRLTLDSFAHHIRLEWRVDSPSWTNTPVWRARPDHILTGIDVSSKSFIDPDAPRALVRRYHLTYIWPNNRSLLAKFEEEGRCGSPVHEKANQTLPATNCPRLPPVSLRYSEMGANRLPQWLTATNGGEFPLPPSRKTSDLVPLDVNADGLPDLVRVFPQVSLPGGGGNRPTLYLNDGVSYQPSTLKNHWLEFTRDGYTLTGDFVSTGELSTWWYLPSRAQPASIGEGPTVAVAKPDNDGWAWKSVASPPFNLNPYLNLKAVGDINGDGLVDFLDYSADGHWDGVICSGFVPCPTFELSSGYRSNTGVVGFENASGWVVPSRKVLKSPWPDGSRIVELADMDGDGLSDLVIIGPFDVFYWPSDGRGSFTTCRGVGCQIDSDEDCVHLGWGSSAAVSPKHIRLADVNGDGYADLINWDRDGLQIRFNRQGDWFEQPFRVSGSSFSSDWAKAYDAEAITINFADMNGNGITDLVVTAGSKIETLDLHSFKPPMDIFAPDAFASRPGLLIEIDNGLGARTRIAYKSTAEMAWEHILAGNPWPNPMPQVLHVVNRITQISDVPNTPALRTYFSYEDPAWDGWRRRLVGFRRVTARRGEEPALSVSQTFYIPQCPNNFCGSTAAAFTTAQTATGMPLTTETFDDAGHYLSTVSHSWVISNVMNGLGGTVQAVNLGSTDTRLYDTSDWQPYKGQTAQAIRISDSVVFRYKVPIRSRKSVLLRETAQYDAYGDMIEHVDLGRIHEDGTPIDNPIITDITMRPPHPSWRFVPERVFVRPFPNRPGVPTDQPRILFYEQDDAGRVQSVSMALSGTLPLQRHHEDPNGAVAPPPQDAAYDSVALIAVYTYDRFDNIVKVEGPSGRCTGLEYDWQFAQLPIAQRVYRKGCGEDQITSTLSWDRGLELTVRGRAATGASFTMAYDGFGRLVETHAPDPVTGFPSAAPTIRLQYLDSAGGPVQRVRAERRMSASDTSVAWYYADGFGRSLLMLSQADPAKGDGGAWVASGFPLLSKGGQIIGAYEPWFYNGDPANHPLNPLSTAVRKIVNDNFGRVVELRHADGTLAVRRTYRPLGIETQDAAGRWADVQADGHGQVIVRSRRLNGRLLSMTTDYLVGGEPARVMQRGYRTSFGGPSIVRWMQYDSMGHMVLNAEPNSTTGFVADPSKAGDMKAWRYAYNWAGQVVGTSDARGCGSNLRYDRVGRPVGEDWSPCLRAQQAYSPADFITGDGTEVFHRYDVPEPGQTVSGPLGANIYTGRLVSTRDRVSHNRFDYDAQGRLVAYERRLAPPGPAEPALASRYVGNWFRTAATYDEGSRAVRVSTGAISPALMGGDGKSELSFDYSARGSLVSVGGSYGALLAAARYDAAGRPQMMQLGDLAGTAISFQYDSIDRIASSRVSRSAPSLWTLGAPGYTPPSPQDSPTTQEVLDDREYHFDTAGELQAIIDKRSPEYWPVGAKPVTRTFQNDQMGRLVGATYTYPGLSGEPSTMAPPGPDGSKIDAAKRPLWQYWAYDAWGSPTKSTDDAGAFFARSLGSVTTGSFSAGPNQIRSADGGALQAGYDGAGNLADLTVVQADCANPAGLCTHRFIYDWDEIGQLARARRWDYQTSVSGNSSTVPTAAPAFDAKYQYDAGGTRVVRDVSVAAGPPQYTVWPLPTLRLENAGFALSSGYQRDASTEVVELVGLGRVIARPGLPGQTSQHVLLAVGDHLGSTSSVIDKATSELVEQLTYLPFGGVETDYRPARWGNIPTSDRFTGKESDDAVGLTYFGARWYHAALGRWISPDPMTVHALSSDPDPYSYVSGQVTRAIDPDGLQACIGMEWYGACAGGAGASGGGVVQIGSGDGSSSARSPSRATPMRSPDRAPAPSNGGWLAQAGNVAHSILLNTPIYATARLIADPGKTIEELVLQRAELVAGVLGMNYSSVHGPIKHRDDIDAEAGIVAASLVSGPGGLGRLGQIESTMARAAAREAEFAEIAAPAAGARNLTAVGDNFGTYASSAQPEPGYYDAIAHGTEDELFASPGGPAMSYTRVATAIFADPQYTGGPIRLVACSAGACSGTAAQTLSNFMGVPVLAPSTEVWAFPSGKLLLGNGTPVNTRPGTWHLYMPNLGR